MMDFSFKFQLSDSNCSLKNSPKFTVIVVASTWKNVYYLLRFNVKNSKILNNFVKINNFLFFPSYNFFNRHYKTLNTPIKNSLDFIFRKNVYLIIYIHGKYIDFSLRLLFNC